MKTYIVQLEDHDDILSARDKITWAKAGRVLLVWPRKGRVLDRRVDLVLLQRHSQQIGVQLGVVTASSEVRAYARDLGIPVFAGPVQAQSSSWRRLRRRPPLWVKDKKKTAALLDFRQLRLAQQSEQNSSFLARLNNGRWWRLAFFAIGVLAFLSMAMFLAPSAEVQLKPLREPQSLVVTVWAGPQVSAPILSGGMPIIENRVVVEGREQINSSGSVQIPDRHATGAVTLTNLTDAAVDVPAGSVVLSQAAPPVRFATLQPVQIPAGPGETVQVAVRAALPGTAGNLPAGQIRAFEGLLGLSLSVDNPDPISGGADRSSPAPNEQDYKDLRARLLDNLRGTALEELRAGLPQGRRLLEGSIHLGQVITEEREPPAGQPADRLQLTVRAEFVAWTITDADLQAVALSALDANLKRDYSAVPGTLSYIFITEPVLDADGTTARWQMRLGREVEVGWSDVRVINAIRGRTVDEAYRVLQSTLILAEPPHIALHPNWWLRLPFLPARIHLVQQ